MDKRVTTGGGSRYVRGIGRRFQWGSLITKKASLRYRFSASLRIASDCQGRSSHSCARANYSLGLIFLNSEARIMASAISFIGLRILRLCC